MPSFRPRLWIAIVAVASALTQSARADYHIASKIQVGGAGSWDYLDVDPVARRLYVTHETHVVVIDMDSLKVVGDVPNCRGMGGVAIAHDLNRGFTANGEDDTITVFALDTLQEIGRWKATGRRPNQIIFEPFTKRVFSFNSTGRNATVFDAATGEILATLPLDGRTEFAAFDKKGMVYDSLQDKATIVAIDARTLKMIATYPLAPNAQPAGTVMDPETRRIFVGCRSKAFLMVDADTGKILQSFPIGDHNDAAKFDPELKLAFASTADGTLTVVHEDSADKFTLVEVAKTEAGVRTMAVDPVTHRIFLPSCDWGPAPHPTKQNPNPRAPMVPDTFRVLVMEP